MLRKLSSIILMTSFVALSSSGILMIVLGSFEFQLQMHPVHKIFGILMSLSGCFHIYFNFKSFIRYLRVKGWAVVSVFSFVILVLLYIAGLNKPIDPDAVKEVEKIMSHMEGSG